MKKVFFAVLPALLLFVSLNSCKNTPSEPEPQNTPTVTRTATLVQSSTATVTATATATATHTAVVLLDQHFNTDLEGWYLNPAYSAASSLSHNTLTPFGALGTTGCAKMECSFSGTGDYGGATSTLEIFYHFPSPVNKQNVDFSMYFYIPPGLEALTPKYILQLTIKTVSNPSAYVGISNIPVATSGWYHWEVFGSSFGAEAGQTTDVSVVIYKPSTSQDWAGDIYFDEFYW